MSDWILSILPARTSHDACISSIYIVINHLLNIINIRLHRNAVGAELDRYLSNVYFNLGGTVKHIWTDNTPKRPDPTKRTSERRAVTLPARLTWKDQRGTTRFATVTTCNVSEFGMYVESATPLSIPLYRLVQVQIERHAEELPDSLKQGRVLSAVYRLSPPSSSKPQGLALRLMVDPRRAAVAEQRRATA